MTKSSNKRVLRRSVRKGVIDEVKRRTGRTTDTQTVRELIHARTVQKERQEAVKNSVEVPSDSG